MIMPSLLTWVVGVSVLVIASLMLRYLANEAHEVAPSQRRASVASGPKGSSTYKKAA
jgi:hypothetical protein